MGAIADNATGIAQFHFSKMEALLPEMVWLVHYQVGLDVYHYTSAG